MYGYIILSHVHVHAGVHIYVDVHVYSTFQGLMQDHVIIIYMFLLRLLSLSRSLMHYSFNYSTVQMLLLNIVHYEHCY